jgi:hypothetical protein
MKKLYLILILILIVGFVHAEEVNDGVNESVDEGMSVSTGNGRMIIYPVLEEGKTTVIGRTVSAINNNNFSVNVSLEAYGDIANITKFEETVFELGPFEEKNTEFTLEISEMKLYEGEIRLRFLRGSFDTTNQSGVSQGLGIVSQVIISPQYANSTIAELGETAEKNDYNWLLYLGIGFIVLVIIIISWGVIKNAGEKP